jgi:hypothetical protein
MNNASGSNGARTPFEHRSKNIHSPKLRPFRFEKPRKKLASFFFLRRFGVADYR